MNEPTDEQRAAIAERHEAALERSFLFDQTDRERAFAEGLSSLFTEELAAKISKEAVAGMYVRSTIKAAR